MKIGGRPTFSAAARAFFRRLFRDVEEEDEEEEEEEEEESSLLSLDKDDDLFFLLFCLRFFFSFLSFRFRFFSLRFILSSSSESLPSLAERRRCVVCPSSISINRKFQIFLERNFFNYWNWQFGSWRESKVIWRERKVDINTAAGQHGAHQEGRNSGVQELQRAVGLGAF